MTINTIKSHARNFSKVWSQIKDLEAILEAEKAWLLKNAVDGEFSDKEAQQNFNLLTGLKLVHVADGTTTDTRSLKAKYPAIWQEMQKVKKGYTSVRIK